MTEPKRMDISEFQEFGYLQEVNRQFFHPLGLALYVVLDDSTKAISLGSILDCRDDPEGFIFDEIDVGKARRVEVALQEKSEFRLSELGFIIQPIMGKS